MTRRAYLAGPEIVLADVREIGARERIICARSGLVGSGAFPADDEDACAPAEPMAEQGITVSCAMEWPCAGAVP